MATNTTIDDQIQERINAFVAELSGLVKSAALEAVEEVLGGGGVKKAPARRGRPPGSGAAKIPRGKPGGKRVRRTAAHLEADKVAFADYVKANPGERLEQISKGLKIDSKHLKRPALLLLEEGAVRKEGERRGTCYFPGGGKKVRAKRKKKSSRKKR